MPVATGVAALVVGSGGVGAGECSGVGADAVEGAGVGVGFDLGREIEVVEILKIFGAGPAPGLPTGVTDAKIKV